MQDININITYYINNEKNNENVNNNSGPYSTSDIAQEYGVSPQSLNKFLVNKNIVTVKRNKKGKLIYTLQEPYKNMGYQKKFSGTSSEGNRYTNSYWTLKGKRLIKDLLEKEGFTPYNENEDDQIINNIKKRNKQLLKFKNDKR